MPWEAEEAMLIDALCRRYGVLPSALLAEDAGILRILQLVALAQADA